MSNYNKLLNNLETLKLNKIRENIDEYIDLINKIIIPQYNWGIFISAYKALILADA